MFRHMLVPLDGSSLAECVLPHAVALQQVFDARVTLARVCEPPVEQSLKPVDPLEWHMVKAEAEAYLDDVAQRLRGAGLEPAIALLEGSAADRIVEYAQSEDVDLIVLSSHGRTGLSRWNVSSVVHKIIQNAKVSFMLVRAYEPLEAELGQLRYQRLMVPLDCSQRTECVLPAANLVATKQDAQLLLAHVVRQPEIPQRTPLSEEDLQLVEKLVERKRAAAAEYMEELASRLDAQPDVRLVVSSDISDALHELAEKEEVDMVMLCAHGFSGKARWPYGSVTMGFIIYGCTPLLIAQDFRKEELEPTRAEIASREQKGH